MDEPDSVIKFHCKNCGRKFSVPQTYAGKKGKCPKCKNIIVIPDVQTTNSITEQTNAGASEVSSKSSAYDSALLDMPQKDKIQDLPLSRPDISEKTAEYEQELEEEPPEETATPAQRKLPWLIDMFLYPISAPGLTNLGIFVGVPLVIQIVRLLLGPFGLVLALPSFIINILIGLYMCWYFAECVRDSAGGGTRAPEAFATTDIGDMYYQTLNLVGCYLLLAGPVIFYSLWTHKTDAIYWSLLAYSVFFFPMGLLSVVMFGSLHGLNPIILIGSIFSTFFPYCGLVLLTSGVTLAFKALTNIQPENIPPGRVGTLTLGAVLYWFCLYIVLVGGYLLGCFYWRYQDKLNWEV